ncbi:MAG: hypothetical protein LBL63_04615 [Clostridiales Family XIII bacterium]|jgi:hypothetical protein|nr:hypothetical protein [Clostridiales Family XIII bacterium]
MRQKFPGGATGNLLLGIVVPPIAQQDKHARDFSQARLLYSRENRDASIFAVFL